LSRAMHDEAELWLRIMGNAQVHSIRGHAAIFPLARHRPLLTDRVEHPNSVVRLDVTPVRGDKVPAYHVMR
jgi:hypothetical protein